MGGRYQSYMKMTVYVLSKNVFEKHTLNSLKLYPTGGARLFSMSIVQGYSFWTVQLFKNSFHIRDSVNTMFYYHNILLL